MAKNANELAEIMSRQLDALTSEGANKDTIKLADAVANLVGKELKLAALQISYHKHRQEGGQMIKALSSD